MCATARILMPRARVRLSAGRTALSKEAQMLCFLAGANSIFFGEKLLTTPNPDHDEDIAMLRVGGAAGGVETKPPQNAETHCVFWRSSATWR